MLSFNRWAAGACLEYTHGNGMAASIVQWVEVCKHNTVGFALGSKTYLTLCSEIGLLKAENNLQVVIKG